MAGFRREREREMRFEERERDLQGLAPELVSGDLNPNPVLAKPGPISENCTAGP